MRIVALIGIGMFVLGPALASVGAVPPLAGFGLFALGGFLALLAGAGAIVGLLRGRGAAPAGVAAIAVGIAFLALVGRSGGSPRINDFTTDVDDPPAFRHAATLPGNAGRDMSYPRAFADVQRGCCPDLAPARLRATPGDALARARSAAERMPAWTVTDVDQNAGTIEAVATSRLFRFQDDIVIRVRPDGDGSRVDMRSKSRDGKGDLGANAARIRAYLAELSRGPAS
jgi:uncharacterized protein (DUF1499 family)